VTDRPYSRHRADTDVNQSIDSSLVRQHGILYGHLCKTFVIIKVLNIILNITELLSGAYTTVCYILQDLMVSYGVSAAH